MTPNLTFAPDSMIHPGAFGAEDTSAAAKPVAISGADILTVKNLSKIFGPKPERAAELIRQGLGRNEIFEQTGNMVAVNDVSLSVKAGEIFVVMGLSGSGKSTLVRLLNRLIEPTSGQVILEGRDIAPMSTPELRDVRRKKMAMVFQSFALLPNRTVLDNIAYGLEVAGLKRAERYDIARTALTRVGLGSYEKLLPGELSGGMQQRVGLARALAVNPSVLLMDEAFSALDPLIRFEMQSELLRLQKEEQRTIVFISHDIEEAIKIGGRIGIMKDGCLIQVGTPAELIQSPADAYVRDFFRNVDVSRFLKASSLMTTVERGLISCDVAAPSERYLNQLIDSGVECGYVCDEAGRYQGCVTPASLHKTGAHSIREAFVNDVNAVALDTDLHQLATIALSQQHDVPVTDTAGRLAGVVSCRTILKQVMERRAA
ncbi:glycine betaine/L-proline transport ATP binding subunit [Burkholderia sp. YR290]|jgi:glycine betaine/proline transport system ATP-binding protein|uniref:quaternary amine ABC transporter ATP-binding protein n=1 Tax=Paraburkholderia hospita TaxID=169430 RepID=UPI0009A84637|nr:glycine betaine/L-proline ABC transporter ATP-binding protein [Paraburkholderia hospita]SKD03147.1 glycine betaine/L-proline transport ATP binding subunit [Paraburkholderia hospita]SOE83311.1 glycine betaine/L-proline transport ATP binding subunit [Burkholderia sp. YR290]